MALFQGAQTETAPALRDRSLIGCTSCIVKSCRSRSSSFRALSGRLKFTVRRHKFNKDSLLFQGAQTETSPAPHAQNGGGGCENRVLDGPTSGREGLQGWELARLYSG